MSLAQGESVRDAFSDEKNQKCHFFKMGIPALRGISGACAMLRTILAAAAGGKQEEKADATSCYLKPDQHTSVDSPSLSSPPPFPSPDSSSNHCPCTSAAPSPITDGKEG